MTLRYFLKLTFAYKYFRAEDSSDLTPPIGQSASSPSLIGQLPSHHPDVLMRTPAINILTLETSDNPGQRSPAVCNVQQILNKDIFVVVKLMCLYIFVFMLKIKDAFCSFPIFMVSALILAFILRCSNS